jgi:hypothetical protein
MSQANVATFPTTYSFSTLLAGTNGNTLKGILLSALNFELSRQIANHPQLKMPVEKVDSPDDLRAEMVLPELEGREFTQKLDVLIDGLVASCALIKDLAQVADYDKQGRIVYPFRYLAERARTPISSVESNFAWRDDMSAKMAGEQAKLLGIKDTEKVEENARKRSQLQNQELINYALAEVNSNTNLNLMKEDSAHLEELLTDLNQTTFDGLKLAHTSAQNAVQRAKARLEAGLYTTIDEEVVLFAKTPIAE